MSSVTNTKTSDEVKVISDATSAKTHRMPCDIHVNPDTINFLKTKDGLNKKYITTNVELPIKIDFGERRHFRLNELKQHGHYISGVTIKFKFSINENANVNIGLINKCAFAVWKDIAIETGAMQHDKFDGDFLNIDYEINTDPNIKLIRDQMIGNLSALDSDTRELCNKFKDKMEFSFKLPNNLFQDCNNMYPIHAIDYNMLDLTLETKPANHIAYIKKQLGNFKFPLTAPAEDLINNNLHMKDVRLSVDMVKLLEPEFLSGTHICPWFNYEKGIDANQDDYFRYTTSRIRPTGDQCVLMKADENAHKVELYLNCGENTELYWIIKPTSFENNYNGYDGATEFFDDKTKFINYPKYRFRIVEKQDNNINVILDWRDDTFFCCDQLLSHHRVPSHGRYYKYSFTVNPRMERDYSGSFLHYKSPLSESNKRYYLEILFLDDQDKDNYVLKLYKKSKVILIVGKGMAGHSFRPFFM